MCFSSKCLRDFQHITYCSVPIDACQIKTGEDQISFDASRYVWLPCGSIVHHGAPYSVYVCVFCQECPVMACARTDRQTNTRGVRGGWEDFRSFCTHLDGNQEPWFQLFKGRKGGKKNSLLLFVTPVEMCAMLATIYLMQTKSFCFAACLRYHLLNLKP